jgi:hypothetical protein
VARRDQVGLDALGLLVGRDLLAVIR